MLHFVGCTPDTGATATAEAALNAATCTAHLVWLLKTFTQTAQKAALHVLQAQDLEGCHPLDGRQ